MLAAGKYLSVELPKTEKIEGTVLTSELKGRPDRHQWIEFTLEGNFETFDYDDPFSDAPRVFPELRKGTKVSVEIARGSRVEIWAISLNGRVHACAEEVLALHRQKGWFGAAMGGIALLIFFILRVKRERAKAVPK